jgi:hypothetical protein
MKWPVNKPMKLRLELLAHVTPEDGLDEAPANINAAINLGLRAIAAPDTHDIHVRIRSQTADDTFQVRAESKREKARWGNKPPAIKMLNETQQAALAHAGGNPNFFVDLGKLANFDRASIVDLSIPLASGRGLWKSVRDRENTLIQNQAVHKAQPPMPGLSEIIHHQAASLDDAFKCADWDGCGSRREGSFMVPRRWRSEQRIHAASWCRFIEEVAKFENAGLFRVAAA